MLSNFVADDGDDHSGKAGRHRMPIEATVAEAEIAQRGNALAAAMQAGLREDVTVTWHWHGEGHVMVVVNAADADPRALWRTPVRLEVLLNNRTEVLAKALVQSCAAGR